MIEPTLIRAMAEAGICFIPTEDGMTRSDVPGWQERADNGKAIVDLWLQQKLQLVVVAKRGQSFVIDLDDPRECQKRGLKPEWLENLFWVDTPSGGIHCHGLSDATTDALRNIVNVHETKGDTKSKKILEVKIAKGSVAAPGAERKGQKNKCDGVYKPRGEWEVPQRGMCPEFLEWLNQHAEGTDNQAHIKIPWEFHPEFDQAAFLENERSTFQQEGYIEDAYHVAIQECPHCGKPAGNSTLRAAKVKFIFGGRSYGFKCHMCGIESREKHEEAMQEKYADYGCWSEYIYMDDDPALVAETLDKLGVEEAPMPEAKAAPETFEEEAPSVPVPKFRGVIKLGAAIEVNPTQVITAPAPAPAPAAALASVLTLKYPELAFPYESMAPGRLKDLVDKACEGGLDPGLACPAIMALASAIPFKDRMDGAKINLYVCLLALVGAGKDTAIKRAQKVLGIYENQVVYTSYAPSGERSIAMLLGDKQGGTKTNPVMIKGPARHCIVTTELEDTLAKARGETSGVLQAMQHYWDHNKKTYADSKKGIQTVDCRVSWLTALPIGDEEISTDAFRLAFGEHTSHGIVDRMLFGFSERKFDGRRSRNWDVPYEFTNFTIVEDSPIDTPAKIQVERHESLMNRLQKAEVTGFAPGVEELYLNWDGSGRRTYDLHKLAVLVALLNDHKLIELEDWKFTCALMDWQARIREVFNTGKAKRIHQGEMNELVIKELEKRTAKIVDGITDSNAKMIEQKNGQGEMVGRPFVRWKAMANAGRWYRYGLDLEKTIEQLQKAAAIQYRETYDDEEPVDKNWIRLMGQPK